MRKPISKKTRFEVFKRDSFTCQYCGKSAPEVVLHVDHIKPVAEGGNNGMLNLITACAGCNLGKGARELNDNTVVIKQKAQLDELNERREQLEMMFKWQEGLSELKDMEIDIIDSIILDLTNHKLTKTGRELVRKLISKHGFNEVMESMKITCEKEPLPNDIVDYCTRVCMVRNSKNDNLYYINYLRKVVRNEVGIENKKRVNIFLNAEVNGEDDFKIIKGIIKRSSGWYNLWDNIREVYGEY